ncbi:AI-2E family transporter [Jatrophihabitans telluris]|uniref:AI-2E family transporter n=1 Tax=Jatrophihabitans telluris TaxID=2038343 RepID=A0ABY4QYV3_9ACTN|nr:AI-2E family transporter [Jatrophihabitans telluris]UQX88730.1 AI-2E family transporter [Jatrophihabitans telluris]
MDTTGAVEVGGTPEASQAEVTIRRPRSVIAFAAWFAVGVGVAYLGFVIIERLRTVVLLVAFALLIGVTLDPLVQFLQRRGLARPVAAFLTWLAVVTLLTAPFFLAADAATSQLPSLIKQVPELIKNAEGHLGSLGAKLATSTSSSTSSLNPTKLLNYVLTSGALLFEGVTDVAVVAFLSLYFAIELPRMRDVAMKAIPMSRRARVGILVDDLLGQVGRYMLSTVLIALLCGAGTAIWAACWGIPYAVLLGALVSVLALVPVLGSTIGGIIVTLVSLTVSLPTAIATLAFYIGYRMAEDYLIQPRVMRYSVELPGVITVPSVILGGAILGIPGALFAVPVALGLRVLVREVIFPITDHS